MVRFDESETRPMGRTASGVRGIKLAGENDEVIGLVTVSDLNSEILVVSENGYGKRSSLEAYRETNRGGQGVKAMNITVKTGALISINPANQNDGLMIINISGLTIRLRASDLLVKGGQTQRARLINIKGNDSIAADNKVMRDEDEENEMDDELKKDLLAVDENDIIEDVVDEIEEEDDDLEEDSEETNEE